MSVNAEKESFERQTGRFGRSVLSGQKRLSTGGANLENRDKFKCIVRNEDKSTYHDVMCARSHACARLDSIAKQASDLVYEAANGRQRRSRVELCILLKQ